MRFIVLDPDPYIANVRNFPQRILHGFFPFSFYIETFPWTPHTVTRTHRQKRNTPRKSPGRPTQRHAPSGAGLSRRKRLAFWALTHCLPLPADRGHSRRGCGCTLPRTGPRTLRRSRRVGGRDYYVMNPGVKSRYFTHVEFHTHDLGRLLPRAQGTRDLPHLLSRRIHDRRLSVRLCRILPVHASRAAAAALSGPQHRGDQPRHDRHQQLHGS